VATGRTGIVGKVGVQEIYLLQRFTLADCHDVGLGSARQLSDGDFDAQAQN
jgi:hypothetical protein